MKRGLSLAALLLLTEAIYLPLAVLRGQNTLFGRDYMFLHVRRLTFARDALLSGHWLPGWYPREMLGTPFSANLQNFPWIPSHLLLLLFNPDVAYGAGIAVAAALTALFTYLFCRRAGLSTIGAVSAAWTFACAGFFAARIMVGHLLLIEAYPSLPLLLWLGDRAMSSARRRDTVALAIATACVVAAGHPQIPAYSVTTALLYVIWHGRGWLRAKLCGAIALGIGTTMAVWWPMLLLIRRSTRTLPLDAPLNDIAMPYRRLLALVVPGIDGWPNGVPLSTGHPFAGYSHPGYFWDTFAYTGILPLAAVVILVWICLAQRRWPASRWLFLAAIGIVALLGALPVLEPLRRIIPVTIMRSPARLLYLCTFSLSAAFGCGVDAVLRWNPLSSPAFARVVVFLCLVFHAWDLGSVSRLFVAPTPWHPLAVPEFEDILAREGGDSRVAISRLVSLRLADKYDDAGGFDAIFLADPYRVLLALTGAPANSNEEVVDAATWPMNALEAAGVRFVITWEIRKDLELVKTAAGLQMYRLANPASRATFRPASVGNSVTYLRPNADLILIRTSALPSGAVDVLEAYDPGWTAEVDGVRAPVLDANGIRMSVPLPAGVHSVRLQYHTPGRKTGAVLSVMSVFMLVVLTIKLKPAASEMHRR